MTEDIRRYQVPTHLKTEDVLSIGYFSFTFRQLTILVLGGGAAYEVLAAFPHSALASLLGAPVVTGIQVGLLSVLIPLVLVLAFVRWRGRTLETWLFVWGRYRLLPRHYRWQAVPEVALRAPAPLASKKTEEEEEG
jgi:hypothetical protein